MANATDGNMGIDFHLPAELKQVVEQAAALRGQSLGDFAVSTLVENAQRIVNDHQVTKLTNRDRDIFLAMLDDKDSQPNDALLASVQSYKDWVKGGEH
ncbi:MAG: hypothetical protein B7Z73_05035 [Planctomycetia bacterium 21-64-5]|nr:MAG: hypothetical protein B7Z73_05035 [Planctomycetia bacterium 21-64-5]HQU44030.1 DUF1778 domain-containing protein [Pirellulales bacterium]